MKNQGVKKRNNSAAVREAVEHARKIAARDARLLELATEFFQLRADSPLTKLEQQAEAARQKIKELSARITVEQEELRKRQVVPVAAMRDLGEPVGRIAERTGMSVKEVRQILAQYDEQLDKTTRQ